MDCKRFSDLLEKLLMEQLLEGERREALEHAAHCDNCRETLEPPVDLVGAILEQTSGSTCDSARRLLCGYVDEELEQIDAELAVMHLQSCLDCAALSRTLTGLAADLPLLAEMAPDDSFVADVLARTLPLRAPASHWIDKLANSWKELLRRPRFAWEGAYVGAFIFALIFVTPGSPLAGVPRKALDLAAANPVARLAKPVENLHGKVSSEARSVWVRASDGVLDVWKYMSTTAGSIGEDLGTLMGALASEHETEEESNNQGEEQ
jgi:hypothetical protein